MSIVWARVCDDCGHAFHQHGPEGRRYECPRCGGLSTLKNLIDRVNELQAQLDHGTPADGEGDMVAEEGAAA